MVPLLQYIKTKWPHLSLIIWHDMLGKFSVEELQPLANLVEPMAWGYVDNLTNYFPQGMFHRFGQVFENIWVASSFKGSSGKLWGRVWEVLYMYSLNTVYNCLSNLLYLIYQNSNPSPPIYKSLKSSDRFWQV